MFFRVTKKNLMHFCYSIRRRFPIVLGCLWYVFFFLLFISKNILHIGLRYVVEMFILYFQFTTCYGQYLHFKYKRSRKIMSDNK